MVNPKLRFKRPDGTAYPDWEVSPLGDIVSENLYPIPNPIQEGYTRLGIYCHAKGTFHEEVAPGEGLDVDTMYVVKKDNLIVNITFAWEHAIAVTNSDDEGKIVSHRFPQYSFSDKQYPLFYKYAILPERFRYAMELASPGGAGRNRVLSKKEFLKIELAHPSYDEQKRIAEAFGAVDRKIAKQEQYVAVLETQKKELLRQVFAREIRFKDENGQDYPEWDSVQIGDLFRRVNERNDGSFDKTHWISVARMYYQEPDKVTSNNIDTRTYVMRYGDMAFEGHPNKEFQYGRFVVNDIGDGVISELFPIYRYQKQEYVLKYWKYAIQVEWIMAPIYRKAITSSGASSNKLNELDFLREYIMVPPVPEQQRIADFFTALDAQIENERALLEDWRQLKKGLLQQMFV